MTVTGEGGTKKIGSINKSNWKTKQKNGATRDWYYSYVTTSVFSPFVHRSKATLYKKNLPSCWFLYEGLCLLDGICLPEIRSR